MSLFLSIRIPSARQGIYLNGGCFVFAAELRRHVRRETGRMLEMKALWKDGLPHHAFLVDPEDGCAYDARGRLPLDAAAIGAGSRFGDDAEIAPVTLAQMKRHALHMDPHNSRIDISQYVTAHEEDE